MLCIEAYGALVAERVTFSPAKPQKSTTIIVPADPRIQNATAASRAAYSNFMRH
jgi:hypothetical protein